jgi:cytochrome P450
MAAQCPFDANRDDRKSATMAAARMSVIPGTQVISSLAFARELLRGNVARQALAGTGDGAGGDPAYTSVFFLDGEPHKRKRQVLSQFFTPKAISTRYRAVMEAAADAHMSALRARGRGRLDTMSYQMAVTVAAEIVGLTNSDQAAMARRIKGTLVALRVPSMSPWRRPLGQLQASLYGALFLFRDVRPAISARRGQRRADVLSHLIDESYPDKAIVVECLTYAVAGMITTREFIVMAAWHLLGDDKLRQCFLAADESGQIAILEEIMRIDPVVNLVVRQATADVTTSLGAVADGEKFIVSIRGANVDEASVGECPHALDPGRARRMKIAGSYLSFGDGSHRCPGAQVALNETRVFLDRLLRVPGIRLHRAPDLGWTDELNGYELRRAIVTCDRS